MSHASRTRCCDDPQWVEEADFGRAANHDLALGRCARCSMPVMRVGGPGAGTVSHVSLTRAEEQAFTRLRDEPERLRTALELWVG